VRYRPRVLALAVVVAATLVGNLLAVMADAGRPAAALATARASVIRAVPSGARPGARPGGRPRRAASAAGQPPSPTFTISPRGGAVALTFDDGPDPRWTPQVLALLAQYHLHATFCLVGIHARQYPALVRQIVAGGHTLCNHTFNHDEYIGRHTPAQIEADLQQTDDAIVAATGLRPRYFRAPAGNWTPQLLAALKTHGEIPLGWSADPRDWARPGVPSIVRTVLSELQPGGILLMHDGFGHREQSVAALRVLLPALAARRLHPVRL
jgi:peptidoglycan/xylan/chitin deacetylase (PgdA/CDA1 family)